MYINQTNVILFYLSILFIHCDNNNPCSGESIGGQGRSLFP